MVYHQYIRIQAQYTHRKILAKHECLWTTTEILLIDLECKYIFMFNEWKLFYVKSIIETTCSSECLHQKIYDVYLRSARTNNEWLQSKVKYVFYRTAL